MPGKSSCTIQTVLPTELKKKLKALAAEHSTTLSEVVRTYIIAGLKEGVTIPVPRKRYQLIATPEEVETLRKEGYLIDVPLKQVRQNDLDWAQLPLNV